jgi:putative DNA primase/helicase
VRAALATEWTDGTFIPPEELAESILESHDQILQRLAALSPLEYDQQRVEQAKRLGCRTSILDKLIEARRPNFSRELQGRAMELADVEPWPESVNGADILNQIAKTFCGYVAMPNSTADVSALWCAHAHYPGAFECSPRANITSPEKRCGKTTWRDVASLLVPRAVLAENLSTAVLFRVVEQYKPTILADECDTWLRDNDELRGMLNAGHRRGGRALRCEGEANEVRAFSVFAPVVLCGIGTLSGTLHDRSIVIRLERAKPGELSKRFDSRRVEYEKELCRKLARFVADNAARLETCDPKMPDGAFNRLADNWRPLFAIAEIAGGDWPQRAATAFFKLTSSDDVDAHGIGTTLLDDIKQMFTNAGADKLSSVTLCNLLAEIEGREWAEWGRGHKPISTHQLAKLLSRFNVFPGVIRVGAETPRGYLLDDFAEAFARYLPAAPFPDCNSATSGRSYL